MSPPCHGQPSRLRAVASDSSLAAIALGVAVHGHRPLERPVHRRLATRAGRRGSGRDALDLEASAKDDGDWVLHGVRSERTVWINAVPEPKTVKNRVHLDLVRRSTGPLVALGGHELREVMGGGETWIVVDDPDGAELCVFDSAQGEPSALVVDSVDAVAQARWWAEVLRAEIVPGAGRRLRGGSQASPGCPFEVWKFVPVPEPKTVKNRMHWDVVCPDVDAAGRARCDRAAGPDDEIDWHVLADPEGNEFCVFAPDEDTHDGPRPDPRRCGADRRAVRHRVGQRRRATTR